MDSIFLLKLTLSFIIGGTWVILATIIADKFGTKIGGLITGLPSTLLFGLLFIAWTQTPDAAVQATTFAPIVGGINSLFLVIFVSLGRKGIWKALAAATIFWAVLSSALIFIKFNDFVLSLAGYILLFIISFYMFEYKLRIKSVKGKKITYTKKQILLRGLISGSIVALSVLISRIGGPLLGGMFAMFPAMFMSTMVITSLTQGLNFASGVAKSAVISAISIVVYSIVVRYTYIPLGILSGTLLAATSSIICGFLIYKFVLSRLN
jgi:hypothetical protein